RHVGAVGHFESPFWLPGYVPIQDRSVKKLLDLHQSQLELFIESQIGLSGDGPCLASKFSYWR
ncbi:MAG: hypothetical protein AAAC48_22145, partial [Phyllobacterium sp.]|uniref:hypothetical protein n=1 Tax=Phyllobacterium sp. TaxID=1871046 RepID=UPI0030F2CBA3